MATAWIGVQARVQLDFDLRYLLGVDIRRQRVTVLPQTHGSVEEGLYPRSPGTALVVDRILQVAHLMG